MLIEQYIKHVERYFWDRKQIQKVVDEEKFCPNILLGLLTGFYGVQKKPWQPEIGDVYFYVAVDEGRNKGVIHNETLFNKNNIKFLLLKKSGKYYKSYFEAEKHLKEDYEYLTGE